MKRACALLLAAALCAGLCACGAPLEEEAVETWTFTDSCGRQVEIPVEVDEIVPSGSLAQMILYTLCPDKLMGLSTPLTRVQKEYIGEEYWDLPVFGQFYGGGSTISYEEIIAAGPDLIIDMGEEKTDIAADMDEIQEQTGIPVIFIQADLAGMAEAYETLGQVTGCQEQAAQLAAYVRETLEQAAEYSAQIPQEERKRVLYSQGEYGTEVNGVGSVHAEVLEYVAAENVAVLDSFSDSGGDEVSIEQIMLWDPEVVVLSPEGNFDDIYDDPTWADVTAVKNRQVYEAPIGPYNWMDRPPSVQRVLAIRWLGNLLYPEVFQYDMIEETQAFYQLFFHYDLSDDQARELLANSTLLAEAGAS